MKEYDVVIVGAGPGGSTAAKEAAEKGLKTIFFERARKRRVSRPFSLNVRENLVRRTLPELGWVHVCGESSIS
ncbi:MAG: FAD-dependent oxidoreductase [Candidatus Thorarchaeota archaeon]|jgi:digeranylgeranylglycerophospholipid reductase